VAKRKPRPVLPQIQNLKSAVVANFAFDAAPGDLGPAETVLRWLNGRAAEPRPPEDIQRHLDGLRARTAGSNATKLVAEKGLHTTIVRAPPIWIREFGLCTFDLDGIEVSVDVFNADDELKLGDQARNVVELFRVNGREVTPLVNAAKELMDATDTALVFGGVSFYVETLVTFRAEGPTSRRGTLGVSDYLWPLMGLRKRYADQFLAALPVHRVLHARRGFVIQAFEDLWTGYEARYNAACEMLELSSFWEMSRRPKTGRIYR
jgi:hypothetical protein